MTFSELKGIIFYMNSSCHDVSHHST